MSIVLSRPIRTRNLNLLPLHEMLVAGGDERLRRDPDTDLNRYGCPVLPDSGLLALGSSTASPISESAYLATKLLHLHIQAKLRTEPVETVHAQERDLLRRTLLRLCQIDDLPGLELQLTASGTDAHQAIARRLAHSNTKHVHTLTIEEAETGSYIVAAMSGPTRPVTSIRLRMPDGAPRPIHEIDAEFLHHAERAIAAGQRVLLVPVDVSKTGLIAPSTALVRELRQRWPEQCDVLIDACQFRFSPAVLRHYLVEGFMVALTGSKFIGGPSFSGAVLITEEVHQRMPLNPAETELPNFGLLLRWRAAMEELRAYTRIPETTICRVLNTFATTLQDRLSNSRVCTPLPVPALERPFQLMSEDWSHIQSIFPFLLRHPTSGQPLTLEQSRRVYQLLQHPLGDATPHTMTRFLLGQPVACGDHNGIQLGALRICNSARMVSEASIDSSHADRILKQALAAIDKIEYITATLRI